MHSKGTSRYVSEFSDAGMSRKFAEAVWKRYNAGNVDLHEVPSLEEQYTFVQNVSAESTSELPEEVIAEEVDWDFEGMVSSEQVATSGVRGKLGEGQCACGDDGEVVPTAIVNVVELDGEGIEAKRLNAILSSPQSNLKAELVELWPGRHPMSGQTTTAEKRIKLMKACLAEVQLTLEKLTDESSWTEA